MLAAEFAVTPVIAKYKSTVDLILLWLCLGKNPQHAQSVTFPSHKRFHDKKIGLLLFSFKGAKSFCGTENWTISIGFALLLSK